MDIVIKEIADKMAEEGMPMIKLAELFIKKPASLIVLFMLADEGPRTVEQISNGITGNAETDIKASDVTNLLDSIKGFGVIDIKNNAVNITDRGQSIVNKLRIKMNNFDKDIDASLCNMKHDCVYDNDNY